MTSTASQARPASAASPVTMARTASHHRGPRRRSLKVRQSADAESARRSPNGTGIEATSKAQTDVRFWDEKRIKSAHFLAEIAGSPLNQQEKGQLTNRPNA